MKDEELTSTFCLCSIPEKKLNKQSKKRSPKSLKGSSISSIKVEKRSPMEGSSDDRLSPFSQRLGIDEEAVAIGGRSHVLRPPKGVSGDG